MILAKPTAVCCCATSPPYLFTSASQAIETLVPTCRTLLFSTRSLVSPVWKIMPRKSQLTTQACIILPFAVVSFGLGYFASSQRRKNNAAYVRVISDEESDGDVVQVQTPHPAWTPGQNQPPPQGLDTGADALIAIVRTPCTESVHARAFSLWYTYEHKPNGRPRLQTADCASVIKGSTRNIKCCCRWYIGSRKQSYTDGKWAREDMYTIRTSILSLPLNRIAQSHATCIRLPYSFLLVSRLFVPQVMSGWILATARAATLSWSARVRYLI